MSADIAETRSPSQSDAGYVAKRQRQRRMICSRGVRVINAPDASKTNMSAVKRKEKQRENPSLHDAKQRSWQKTASAQFAATCFTAHTKMLRIAPRSASGSGKKPIGEHVARRIRTTRGIENVRGNTGSNTSRASRSSGCMRNSAESASCVAVRATGTTWNGGHMAPRTRPSTTSTRCQTAAGTHGTTCSSHTQYATPRNATLLTITR